MDSLHARARSYLPELAILAASILYGATFAVVKDALETTTPSAFNVMRFTLGALVMFPFALRQGWSGPSPRPSDTFWTFVRGSVALGAVTAFAYQTQNLGLEQTTTSNSAFITGLAAVFVPVFEAIWFRRVPRRGIYVALAMSLLGLFLLTGAESSLELGDVLTLCAAAAFGLWYVVVGELVPRFQIVTLTAVQLAAVAFFSLCVVPFEGWGTIDRSVLLAVVFTGIGCSAIAFAIEMWAQRTIEPSRAGILMLFEPVVAGLVGYAIGERLGVIGYLGALMILAGIVVVEIGTHRSRGGDQGPLTDPQM
ncbi:MAG: DMT family transporter [Acidimicrobiia bacterium]|nr:DMT family transporter [Acidimicrobiia bacterium]